VDRYDILYVGGPEHVASAQAYAEQHRSVTIAGDPGFAPGTVSLAVLVATADAKPRVLISPRRSRAENVEWNSSVLRVGTATD
jgi:hypothetical protein